MRLYDGFFKADLKDLPCRYIHTGNSGVNECTFAGLWQAAENYKISSGANGFSGNSQ